MPYHRNPIFPCSLQIQRPSVGFYTGRIDKKEYFSFPKCLCGFWWKLAGTDWRSIPAIRQQFLQGATGSGFYEPGHDTYYGEVIELLRRPQPDGLFLGVSHLNFPGDLDAERNSPTVFPVMEEVLGQANNLHCGLIWKYACYTGQILDFIETISKNMVVIVGMPHLASIPKSWNLPRSSHFEVMPPIATQLDQTVENLASFDHSLGDQDKVYLFQLGGSACLYIIYKLHRRLRNAWLIDMGRALDAWTPEGDVEAWVGRIRPAVRRRIGLPR